MEYRITQTNTIKSCILQAVSLLLIVTILLSSCSSFTMIHSLPDGAKLYIDGEPVGNTPYMHTDTKIVGSTTTVKLEKEGYEPFYTSFSKDEEVNLGAIIGGLFVWVPFLWTMKYKPTHTYEMIPKATQKEGYEIVNKLNITEKSKEERLKELKSLYNQELITKEEYEQKKSKILEELAK